MNDLPDYMPQLRDALARLPDDRLMPLRRKALEQFSRGGLPTVRDEDWKYTDLSPALQVGFDAPAASTSQAAIEAATRGIDADWLVIANGNAVLREVAGADVRLLSETAAALGTGTAWTQLNTALLRDGFRIHIERGAVIGRPIGLLFMDDAAHGRGMSQGRVEIDMAEGSKADFVELHVSGGDSPQHANSVIELRLGPGSRVNHVRIQDRARHHSQTARLDVSQRRASEFNHAAFDFGGALIRNDLVISIDEAETQTAFDGLYLGGNGQHIDNHTRVDHCVGPGRSRQEYRGILTGDARCVWNGKAVVHKGADGTDAAQANHNLLLSDQAEVDAKPELEIYADEVKCSHGATVGQLDDTALYYLRTRGLDAALARQVLIHAFARAVVDRVPVATVAEALTSLLGERLSRVLGGPAQ